MAWPMHGVKVGGVELDLPAMMAQKTKVVDANTAGVVFLFKKNKVEWIKGKAKITAPGAIEVALNAGGNADLDREEHHHRHRLRFHAAGGRAGG